MPLVLQKWLSHGISVLVPRELENWPLACSWVFRGIGKPSAGGADAGWASALPVVDVFTELSLGGLLPSRARLRLARRVTVRSSGAVLLLLSLSRFLSSPFA